MAIDHERRRDQTEVLYSAIGKFVVEFSQFTMAVELGIGQMLGEDPDVLFLTAGQEAGRLTDAFASLCARRGEDNWSDTDHATLKAVRREIRKLLHERNRLAHDIWFVGWGDKDETDWTTATTWRPTLVKRGLELRLRKWSVGDIDALRAAAERLRMVIYRLTVCAVPPDDARARDANYIHPTPATALTVTEHGVVDLREP